MLTYRILAGIWIVLGVYWLISALFTKQAVRRQTSASRSIQVLLSVAGYFLLFDPAFSIGILSRRIIPPALFVTLLGIGLTAVGAAFAVWARIVLAGNWSSDVTVKENHVLTTRGPYRVVRHPIYSGLLLAVLATAISFGLVRCFVGWLCVFTGFWMKLRVEEQFMTQQFGGQYVQYSQRVKALIPKIL